MCARSTFAGGWNVIWSAGMGKVLSLASSAARPVALCAIALLSNAAPAARAVEVGGVITTDTTWSASGSPYLVTDHITVRGGVTLTIEPGVAVQFGEKLGLYVQGRLHAVGTVQNMITFTGSSSEPAWWRGIQITDAGSAVIEWCQVAYAGYWDSVGVSKTGSGELILKHSTVRGHAGDGLRLAAGYSNFVSQENAFQDNTTGVRLGIGASFDDSSSTFTGNGRDVHVAGGTVSGQAVWGLKPEYSLYVAEILSVAENGLLVIRPGTVVKFGQNTGLFVSGTLQAEGTAAQPVHLTDWRDDTVGGDANRDGNQSGPEPEWWRGLFIQATGSGTLRHTMVRFGGYWDSIGIKKTGAGTLTLTQCTVSQIRGDGLRLESSPGTTTLQETTLTGNSESGLRLVNGNAVATACVFKGNGRYGILQDINDTLDYAANEFAENAWGSVGVNGGTLTGPMNWVQGKGESFTIVVRDHFTVPAQTGLTIQPGIQVQFAEHTGLFVRGTLTAVGTTDSPIRFTGATDTPGSWRGIQMSENGSADLQRCEISAAGYWDGAGVLKIGTGALTLKNSILRGHTGDGLRVAGGYSAFVSQDNVFRDNTQGVRLGVDASFDDNTSTFSGNEIDLFVEADSMSGEVIWSLDPAYSVYVSNHLTVRNGARLLIRPGTVVKMRQNCGVFVDGVLEVAGTAAAPVYVTDWRDDTVGGDANHDAGESAPGPAWWRGVFIRAGSATINHCTLRYAGYWDSLGISKTGAGTLSVNQSTISQVGGSGMRIENSSGLTTLQNSTFTGNAQSGLRLVSGAVAASGCAFKGNAQYGIHQDVDAALDYSLNEFAENVLGSVGVNGGTLTGAMNWSKGNGGPFTFVVREHITVPAGTSLTVQPGAIVQFAANVGLFVTGTLTATGTAENPIRFVGGKGTANEWRGIQVTGTGAADLDWCEISSAGYWDSVGLLKTGTGALTLKNSTLRGNGGDGLRIDGSTGTHEITGCAFVSNGNGVFVKNQSVPVTIGKSRFELNTSHGALNQGPAELDARQCWWGDSSGPYHATLNPQGAGNKVSDLVLFEPWQTTGASGTLTVTLEPAEAIQAGASWSVDGSNWQSSGTTLSLEPGSYTVRCKVVDGWTSPADHLVAIAGDQATAATRVYTRASQPTAGTILAGPDLNEARMGHTIATLPDGRVVLFGGHGTGFKALASAEIWSPSGEAFTTLTMRHSHDWPAFAMLHDGRFLLAGGSADLGVPKYAEAELFDPKTDSFTATGNLVRFRSGSGAAALSGGQVLVAGAWWTHNDAHTYGELFNPETATFTATGPLGTRRAYPIVLPTTDNRAIVIGGYGVNGGANIPSTEEFDPATGEFVKHQDELFPDDPGWGISQDQRPIEAQKLADGRFLLLAHRAAGGVTEYTLFTFDSRTKRFERMPVTPNLPSGKEYVLWAPVIDTTRGRAHLVAQSATANPTEVSLFSVDLDSGSVRQAASNTVLNPAYSLGGAAVTLLQDGRVFVTGGSEDGSNFKPVRRTLFVTPGDMTSEPKLVVDKTDAATVKVSWTAAAGAFVLETSTNLVEWASAPGTTSLGDLHSLAVSAQDSARFYRLRQVPLVR